MAWACAGSSGRETGFARVGSLVLLATRTRLTDDLLRASLDQLVVDVRARGAPHLWLTFAPDHGLSSEQRRIVVDEYGARIGFPLLKRVALMSSSLLVRGTITALHWLDGSAQRKTRAFHPAELQRALGWLREGADFSLRDASDAFRELLVWSGFDPTTLRALTETRSPTAR